MMSRLPTSSFRAAARSADVHKTIANHFVATVHTGRKLLLEAETCMGLRIAHSVGDTAHSTFHVVNNASAVLHAAKSLPFAPELRQRLHTHHGWLKDVLPALCSSHPRSFAVVYADYCGGAGVTPTKDPPAEAEAIAKLLTDDGVAVFTFMTGRGAGSAGELALPFLTRHFRLVATMPYRHMWVFVCVRRDAPLHAAEHARLVLDRSQCKLQQRQRVTSDPLPVQELVVRQLHGALTRIVWTTEPTECVSCLRWFTNKQLVQGEVRLGSATTRHHVCSQCWSAIEWRCPTCMDWDVPDACVRGCDTCGQWFHMDCTPGVPADADVDWQCPSCCGAPRHHQEQQQTVVVSDAMLGEHKTEETRGSVPSLGAVLKDYSETTQCLAASVEQLKQVVTCLQTQVRHDPSRQHPQRHTPTGGDVSPRPHKRSRHRLSWLRIPFMST